MKTKMTLIRSVALAILFCSVNSANATTYPVTNINDAGAGSLRQAIIDANANSGADIIDATGGTGTINITSELAITDAITINGPGASLLNVHSVADFTNNFRVFNIANVAATLSGLTISGGYLKVFTPGINGAGILNAGQLNVINCTVAGNTLYSDDVDGFPGYGVGIYNAGILTVENTLITNNLGWEGNGGDPTAAAGSGIYNSGTAHINNSTISSNEDNNGGGIANHGKMIIDNTSVINNKSGGGGGIQQVGDSLTVTNCTISGNLGDNGGGMKYSGGPCSITNTTITGNDGYGGGIYNTQYSLVGIVPPGVFTIGNSIVAGNINSNNAGIGADYYFPTGGIPPEGYANLTSLGHNIFGKVDAPYDWTFTGTGDQVGSYASPIDPLLGPLADNGGPTFTHALLAGSPAINTGSCVTTTDQRGIVRPQGSACDIGSFEFEECLPPTGLKTTNVTSTGAQLNWNAVPGAIKYKILYKVQGTSLWTTVNRKATAVSYILTGLTSSTTYVWKMKTVCSIGQSPASTQKKFTTTTAFVSQGKTTTSESATAASLNAVVMPNPNNGDFHIDMNLPANKASTTLQLYDDLGVKVWQQNLGMLSGSISKSIYLENKLPSGVYTLMIERNDFNYTTKIVITK